MVRKLPQSNSQLPGGSSTTSFPSSSDLLPPCSSDAAASFSDIEPRRDSEAVSDNDSEICDLALEGAHEDEILQKSVALTEDEVVQRRSRRVKQLMKLYRMQYWGLLEELRSKYRVFYIKHGRGGWKDDVDAEKEKLDDTGEGGQEKATKSGDGVMKEPLAPERYAGETLRCAHQGCKAKAMALSVYCFAHILSEPRQQLYKPCSFVIRSGQSGTITCGKPVLRSVTPSYCSVHMQKQSTRGVRKANTNTAVAAPKVPGPKLHYVIAEYVRLIQSKRRAARDAALKHVLVLNDGNGPS